MSDLFDSGGEQYDPFQPDAAEQSAPDGSTTEVEAEASTVAPETVQSDETALEAPAIDEEAKPDEVAEDKTAEKTSEEVEAEIEARLADPKSPKWLKNAVDNVYKPKIATLNEEVEHYRQYGSKEDVGAKLDLLNGLNTVRSNPQTGVPEITTEPFVKGIYDKDPKIAYQLLNDLVELPSPHTQGWTVLQEILKRTGIDPTRLDDVKQFAANGYQLQQGQYPAPPAEELALIPAHLQQTFAALSPEMRDMTLADPEHIRNANLENARIAQESTRQQTHNEQTASQREAQDKARRDQEFTNTVNTKGFENFTKSGETVFTSFVDSLAKQAQMTNMDSMMIANTVLNSFEPTLAGRQSLAMLKAEGIDVDPMIPSIIAQMEQNSKDIAYFEAIQDKANYEQRVAKQVEFQERLAAKGNKIIASLALKKSKGVSDKIVKDNASLADTQNTRYAAAGVGTTVGSNGNKTHHDFSDEGYMEDLRASGFGGKR